MSVDSAAAAMDAPITDTASNITADADAALDAVWEKHNVNNGAERATNGKFSSPNKTEASGDDAPPAGAEEPLEGGGGEDSGETGSTLPLSTVPLPSNWQSNEMKEAWAKIPADIQPVIAAHDAKIRETLSKQGNALATWKPISDILNEFGEYFDGRKASHAPDAAIRAVFSTVRDLDAKPVETLISLANDYNVLDKLAAAFRLEGDEAGGMNTQNAELVAKIGELESTIRALQSGFKPEIVDERVSQILFEKGEHAAAQEAISRTSKDMPLFDDVPEDDMVHYIHRAKAKLNGTGSKDAVLKLAYDMAVNADPDLRARAAALKGAAVNDAAKVADARRANSTNLPPSTSSGRPRDKTEDEVLDGIWEKHHQRA